MSHRPMKEWTDDHSLSTINVKGSITFRILAPTQLKRAFLRSDIRNFIKKITEAGYTSFGKAFKVQVLKDGLTFLVEIKHPDLLAREVNLVRYVEE